MKWHLKPKKVIGKVFGHTQNTALGVQLSEMEDARYGITYMLAHTNFVKKPAFSLDLTSNFVADTTAISDLKDGCTFLLNKTNAGAKIVSGLSAIGDKMDEVKAKIKAIIVDFFRGFGNKIKQRYMHALQSTQWIGEFISWAVSSFAGNLSNLIPGWGYVQAAADLYSGVRQAVVKAKDFIHQMWSGYNVKLLGGHPSIIASALARHSAVGFAGGIKKVALTTVSVGLEAAGDAVGGAGTIVSAVFGLLERIIGLVDYFVQFGSMKHIRNTAKKMWEKELLKKAANKAIASAKTTALKTKAEKELSRLQAEQTKLSDHKEFSQWFRKITISNPIVAALAMGSGFAGHPYRFLQLLQPEGTMLNDADFSKGVHHIETLKKLSTKYVQEYTDNYGSIFKSEDNLIQARLAELQTGKGVLSA